MPFHAGLAIGAGPIEPNVQQFIQRISIRQPGSTFLFRAEQIAVLIERESNREANPGADGFTLAEIGRHFLNRAAIGINIVFAHAILIDQISVGIVHRAKSEIDVAFLIHCDANRVDILSNLFPARCDDNLFIRFVIAVCIDDQRHLALARDKNSIPFGVAHRRQQHAQRPA